MPNNGTNRRECGKDRVLCPVLSAPCPAHILISLSHFFRCFFRHPLTLVQSMHGKKAISSYSKNRNQLCTYPATGNCRTLIGETFPLIAPLKPINKERAHTLNEGHLRKKKRRDLGVDYVAFKKKRRGEKKQKNACT